MAFFVEYIVVDTSDPANTRTLEIAIGLGLCTMMHHIPGANLHGHMTSYCKSTSRHVCSGKFLRRSLTSDVNNDYIDS